jgi:hypothetical protein
MVLFKVKTSVSHEYTYFDCSLMALVRIPYKLHPKLEKSELINKIGNVRCFPSTADKHRITLIYSISINHNFHHLTNILVIFIYITEYLYVYLHVLFVLTWQDQQQCIHCASSLVTINNTIFYLGTPDDGRKTETCSMITFQQTSILKTRLWLTDILYIIY